MAKTTLLLGRHPTSAEQELSLPKPPGVIRQFWVRHPWWTDSIVAGAYFLPTFFSTLALFVIRGSTPGWLAALGLLAIGASAAALLFRRHRPWTVLFVIWGTTAAVSAVAGAMVDIAAIPIALYSIAVYRSTRDAWLALAGSAVVGTVVMVLASGIHRTEDVSPFGAPVAASSSQLVVLLLLATVIGINIGNRKRYLAALVDRAAQLVRERDQQAQLAAAAERSRIAREMHDIVSHSLTVMVSLADGSAAAIVTSPDQSRDAMRHVAETGRHALSDMRRMLGVLTEDSDGTTTDTAALEPQPGIEDLHSLVETFRAAGLPVRLTISGRPPEDPGLQLTVYRVVQEALTNALRYAREATLVTVEAIFATEQLRVTVADDGPGGGASGSEGAGRGLVGMRERVALYSGSLASGPLKGGGWRVAAVFRPENREDPAAEPAESSVAAPPAIRFAAREEHRGRG